MSLTTTNKQKTYLIVKFDEQHDGHELNKELYDNLPRNKRLNLEEKEVVINMMDNGADACMVAEFMRNNSNKQVRSRDIWQVVSLRNLQLKKTDPENQNNLLQQTINRIIDQDNGNYFSFLYDNTPEKNLLMIFYQNPRMKALYQRYGVILFIDGTYNVNKNKYAVYLIVVRDCHGHSQIVAWAVLAHERFVLIDTFFDVFAKNNDVSINKTIVIDKDLTERKSIENHFPNSTVFYCKFHCIQSRSIHTQVQ